MIENFATLDDVFADSLFDELVKGIQPKEVVFVDPEIERFKEIIEWVKENGREPMKSQVVKERKLYSRLKGIRGDSCQIEKYKSYDVLNLLGSNQNE